MRHPIKLPPNNLMHDDRMYIREIQEYLRYLSFYDPELLEINVDGVFGPETTRAVRLFQNQFRITPTGRIDLITWNLLYTLYLAALNPEFTPLPPRVEQPISPEGSTDQVG